MKFSYFALRPAVFPVAAGAVAGGGVRGSVLPGNWQLRPSQARQRVGLITTDQAVTQVRPLLLSPTQERTGFRVLPFGQPRNYDLLHRRLLARAAVATPSEKVEGTFCFAVHDARSCAQLEPFVVPGSQLGAQPAFTQPFKKMKHLLLSAAPVRLGVHVQR